MQPKKGGRDVSFEPHGSDVNLNAYERQDNKPNARPRAQVQKQGDDSHDDEDHAHAKEMDVRPFEGPDELF